MSPDSTNPSNRVLPSSPEPAHTSAQILQAHQLYCDLTGQKLSLGFDRERMWFELLRRGFGLKELRRVIGYLQREIRDGRRNIGALKLSNLLQPDRFEEDLNISRVLLESPPSKASGCAPSSPPSPQEKERARLSAQEALRQLKKQLGYPPRHESM